MIVKYLPKINSIFNVCITSGNIWIIDVSNSTPPPKHNKTEVSVRFQPLLSCKKYTPILRGKNPKMRETPPNKTILKILAVIISIFIHLKFLVHSICIIFQKHLLISKIIKNKIRRQSGLIIFHNICF